MSFDNASDATFSNKTDVFLRWLQQQCGATVSKKIQVEDYRSIDAGRGVVALQDIDEDEELFCIPLSCVLTTKKSDLSQIRPHILDRLDPWNALVLVMIYEHGKGMTSTWWPYLNILPTDFDTLIYWSPLELAELQGSAVIDKIGKDDADHEFICSLLPLIKESPSIFGIYAQVFGSSGAQALLLALAHRMATLIMAYGFDIEPKSYPHEVQGEDLSSGDDDSLLPDHELEKAMVPLADLLNADGDMNNAHLIQHKDSMIMIALKQIPKGQQVFNDFGPLPRSDLLRRYGYVTEKYKKFDVVEISIESVRNAASKINNLNDEESQERLQLAARWGALEDAYDLTHTSGTARFELDEDMLLTIEALLLDTDSHKRITSVAKLCERRLPTMSMNLCLVLKDIIKRRLDTYATPIAQDVNILQNMTLQKRHRMAIEVRLGEKEILAAAADEIDQSITAIEARGTTEKRGEKLKRKRL